MGLREAQSMLSGGVKWGDVFPLVADADREELRHWYCRTPEVPVNRERPKPVQPTPTGDTCRICFGLTVRTGTCMTCQACGDSSGGCG